MSEKRTSAWEEIANAIDDVYRDRMSGPAATDHIVQIVRDAVVNGIDSYYMRNGVAEVFDEAFGRDKQQWWFYEPTPQAWFISADQSDSPAYLNPKSGECRVYGTTVERDGKRDAMIEAVRKAGKP